MTTAFFTTAPARTRTPRNSTLFSTVPSMMQPSATSELDARAPSTYFAGTSSRDLPLQAVVEVDGGPAPTPKITRKSTFGDLERHPRGKPIFDGFIAQVLGSQPKLEDMNLSPQDYAAAKKARETMIIFIREITLEKMVMMSQGAFTEDALQGILAAVGNEPDAARK